MRRKSSAGSMPGSTSTVRSKRSPCARQRTMVSHGATKEPARSAPARHSLAVAHFDVAVRAQVDDACATRAALQRRGMQGVERRARDPRTGEDAPAKEARRESNQRQRRERG